ncbi:MAG: MFS transporter [Acidimicrobiia bacterium]
MAYPGTSEEVPQPDRWLTPGVRGIGAASLLSDLGHEVPTSLLPAFLTSTLGAPVAALGIIEGISDGLAGLARLGGGALADDPHRRRNVAVGGYTATAVMTAGIGLATGVWQVAVLRAGAWTARGLRVPARNALLADSVAPEAYGRAYGFERAMDNLGAIGGPLLAIGLVAAVGVRSAILVSVIPGLLAALAIVYAVRHIALPRKRARQPIRLRVRPVLRGRLGRAMGGIGAFELGNVAATLLILRTTEQIGVTHGAERATTIGLLLYAGYNLAATLTSIAAGHTGDRIGMIPVLGGGIALFALAYGGFAVATTSIVLLAVLFVAAGIGIGCVETAEHAVVASLAPEGLRGSAFGLLAAVQSFGNLVASSVAGILWTLVSPTAAFGYAAACMLAALGLLALLRSRDGDG